ncbi:DUF1330 domain-containing protein [Marinomonas epiphytica]
MTALMIVLASVNSKESEQASAYSEGVKSVLQQYGGTPQARYPITDQLVGEHRASVMLQVAFQSAESVRNFLESAEYQALLPMRDRGFSSMQIYVSEG